MHLRIVPIVFALVFLGPVMRAGGQRADERLEWNKPFVPFTIVGNVHYVGAAGVSSFLITGPAGSFLIDGGLPETAPQIAQNVAALGFKLTDVKYLLNSHAHFDHAGGLDELARLSGASVVVSERDAESLKTGSRDMPAVTIARTVKDGDALRLGGVTLTARMTPGHTKGCTTWTTTTTESGRTLDVVFHCSTSVVDRLVDNTAYPGIVSDYERSFALLRTLPSDVFLAPHPAFFDMETKRKKMSAGGANPFVDRSELRRFVDQSERQFKAELKKQMGR